MPTVTSEPLLEGSVRVQLFDLDGVLTDSAVAHASAWAATFDGALSDPDVASRLGLVDRNPFDRVKDYRQHVDGRLRLDGIARFLTSRGASPETLLSERELVDQLAADKDERYRAAVADGEVHVYEDARQYLRALRERGTPTAVVSSSANTRLVLSATDLLDLVDVVVDALVAAEHGLRGKPAPDTFLHAAAALDAEPSECAVFEDAVVGVEAARAGGFGVVVGVDRHGRGVLADAGADIVVSRLTELSA